MGIGETSLGGVFRSFPQTAGALLDRVSDDSPDVQQSALDELFRGYWKPVYHCLRAAFSRSNEDAKDLTQAFFLWVMETRPLKRYTPRRGSFRAFLKSLLKHFVQHHDEALRRLKRGGGVKVFPIDEGRERPVDVDPDRAFQAAWRSALIDRAIQRVRDRSREGLPALRFEVFEAHDMVGPDERLTYAALAARFRVKSTDVHNYLVRMREEVRLEVRSELARTTGSREELEEEWRDFLSPS
jgi:RNA polymerase sigma factor (sigma-70 family)